MKKKCYIYMRVSTAMQVDGYSLEAQKERLMKFAEFQEMEVVREYCDAGKSGKSITGRPEFQRMLQDVSEERDGVAFILVFKLSRFGRNAADVLNSLQFIQDYGVNLICVEDGIDSSKDSGCRQWLRLKGRIFWFRQWREESRRPERENGMADRLLSDMIWIQRTAHWW